VTQTGSGPAVLERALALAQPEGYRRVFLDEGKPIAQLLALYKSRRVEAGYTSGLLTQIPLESAKVPPCTTRPYNLKYNPGYDFRMMTSHLKKYILSAGWDMAETRNERDPVEETHNEAAPDPRASACRAGFFEIRVKGHLNPSWSDWLEGMEVELLDNGEMILSGVIIDQAALMGVLNKLYRLNLTLLSVNEVDRNKWIFKTKKQEKKSDESANRVRPP
jgi:hypothetical protein